jgi:O-antigen ligase
MKSRTQMVLLALGLAGLAILFIAVTRMPGLFTNVNVLGGLIALQIACFGLWHFESIFFPLLMGTFLLAGLFLPFSGAATSMRWLFLAVGAFGGLVIWIRDPRIRRLGAFHLIAAFCVASALLSAAVSEVPETALLKVASLFLLFLYAATGARLAIVDKSRQFAEGLILACELLVYFAAICYFILRVGVFGNPNGLGSIIGTIVTPVMLWAAEISATRGLRQRRLFALALCAALLYLSDSRASILGATVAVLVFTIVLRHQRMMLQCLFVLFLFLTAMATVNPSRVEDRMASVTERILYKDHGATAGVFGSRFSPWEETLRGMKRHPWFGSGFGTSELGDSRPDGAPSSVYTTEGTNREHGNSYLALAEYLGILGAIPFAALLLFLIAVVVRVLRRVRNTANFYQLCTPLALVLTAGLVHAFFEDWLFAVGSYLCVFFWVAAFLLMDLVPDPAPKFAVSPRQQYSSALTLASPVPR